MQSKLAFRTAALAAVVSFGVAGRTYQFTLQVTDQIGATDQENFTVTVA